jgi:hypothetical protein
MYKCVTLFCFLSIMRYSYAQEAFIVRVVDNLTKKPVNNASIQVGDSINGTKSNFLGFLQLKSVLGDTIHLSHPDYESSSICLTNNGKITVGLDLKESKLDFTGGIEALYKQLGASLTYPSSARSRSIQQMVLVEFRIDSLGKMVNVKVYNDVKKVFEKDIIQVFKKLKGNWSKNYIDLVFILPITYRIAGANNLDDSISLEGIIHNRVLSEFVITAYSSVSVRKL